MLTPIPLPRAPEAAASLLSDALAGIAEESGTVSREAAVGAFRRHLARIQSYVQHAFEHEQITGLQAARLLGALIDGVVAALFEHSTTKVDLGLAENLEHNRTQVNPTAATAIHPPDAHRAFAQLLADRRRHHGLSDSARARQGHELCPLRQAIDDLGEQPAARACQDEVAQIRHLRGSGLPFGTKR